MMSDELFSSITFDRLSQLQVGGALMVALLCKNRIFLCFFAEEKAGSHRCSSAFCCQLLSPDSFLLILPTGLQYGYVANSGASSASVTTSGGAATAAHSSSGTDDDEEEEDEDEEAGLLQL